VKERDATRLRLSVMKENRLFPIAVSKAPFTLNDDFNQISLEFFSGHIRAEMRTPSGTYDLACLAPQLPFAGGVGLVRFYDSIVNVRNFSVLDAKESYAQNLPKQDQKGFDTFVCHSSNDKPIVEDLVSRLRARDVTAWVDHEQIKLGDRVTEKINQGLSNSRSILVVLSKSLGQGRWVAPEYGAFINAALAGGSMRRVFPLQIEDVTPDEVPPLLVDLRRARYSSQTEFDELVREIKHQAA
jgi:TIR domain